MFTSTNRMLIASSIVSRKVTICKCMIYTGGMITTRATEENTVSTAIVLSCIASYCIVLCCIVLSCLLLSCVEMHCIVLYCLVLHCIVLFLVVFDLRIIHTTTESAPFRGRI